MHFSFRDHCAALSRQITNAPRIQLLDRRGSCAFHLSVHLVVCKVNQNSPFCPSHRKVLVIGSALSILTGTLHEIRQVNNERSRDPSRDFPLGYP